jgi:hypothetical protein
LNLIISKGFGNPKTGREDGSQSTEEEAVGRKNRIGKGITQDNFPLGRNHHSDALKLVSPMLGTQLRKDGTTEK